MGSYVIRMKVLPEDVSTDLDKLLASITSGLPAGSTVRSHKVEPIAFGLSAMIIDVVAPEEEGTIEKVEQSVSSAHQVGQVETMGVSRMSSRLPPQ